MNLLYKSLFKLILIVFCFVFSSPTYSDSCGSLENHFGPFDYTDPSSRAKGYGGSSTTSKLSIVEHRHFTPEIEMLIKGGTTASPLPDLDYTLHVFPNHHRALMSIIRFKNKYGKNKFSELHKLEPECYLSRAIRFNPKDSIVRMLYGIYLHTEKKYKAALKQYQMAEKYGLDSSELYYNMGLLYLKLGDNNMAKTYAKKAYLMNFPLPGLKNKLTKLNLWP